MPDSDRLPYEDSLDDLLKIYAQAQRTLLAQVEAVLRAGQLERARQRQQQLKALLGTLRDLGFDTDAQARRLVAKAFGESAARTGALIGAHAQMDEAAFAGVSKEVVETLQDSIVASLRDARVTVGRQINDVFAKAGRRAAIDNVLGARGSRRAASDAMVKRLRERGIASFVDRAGRNWQLENYASMAVRTVTREAVVEGAKARMVAQGIALARVSTSASACAICAPWQGRVVSLEGTSRDEDIPTLDALPGGGPPFHPNCRHTLLPEVDAFDDFGGDGEEPPGGGGAGGGGEDDDIAGGLNVVGASIRPHVNTSAGHINRVHRRPRGLQRINVDPLNESGGTRGTYDYGDRTIAIQPPALGSTRPELTFAHEYGHMLDHLHFGSGEPVLAGFASEVGSPQLAAWRTAINDSDAVKNLRAELATNPVGRIRGLKYLLMDAELWARSYAQWIATRSGDRLLIQQVRAIIQEEPNRQWSDRDFEAIGREFDKLFRELLR